MNNEGECIQGGGWVLWVEKEKLKLKKWFMKKEK
jgi:hypothetical protein